MKKSCRNKESYDILLKNNFLLISRSENKYATWGIEENEK